MKRILLSVLFLILILALSVSAAQFSEQKMEIGCKNGDIVVSGSFNASETSGEKYNVYFATYKESGIVDRVEISPSFTVAEGSNSFEAAFEVRSNQQITEAFLITDRFVPICEPVEKTVRSLRILSIGNSFSIDAQEWLYGIAKDGGFDNVILGNLYIGGCSLQTHYNNSVSGAAAYTYYKNSTGTWTNTSSKTMLYGITDESWDYITLQQNSGNSGAASTYDPYLTNLITYVNANKLNPDAPLLWHMTWAYDKAYASTSAYGSQDVMYTRIIDATKQKIVPNDSFSMIIPSGTAIQNARTSFIGDAFNRDGFHLDYTYGRYLAGLTWFHKITGQPIDDIDYIPNNSFSKEYLDVLKEAAKNAVLNPFEVTQSQYVDKTYDFENYVELEWTPEGLGYYNSAFNSTPQTTQSNSKNFIYTRMFTKDELPSGTLLTIDSGYQYRPEGWVSLDTKNESSARPGNVTASIVEIDDEWWGSFNYRAFNIAVAGNAADLTGKVEETASHFKIYLPKGEYDDYELIDWEPKTTSFYNSISSSTPAVGTDLAKRFISSKMFTRETLPVGSIIVVDSGYGYRPEGWVDLSTKNDSSTRPANVTVTKTVVTEEWWGNFNYRAFNLYKTDNSNIDTIFDEAKTHLRIYVPKSSDDTETSPTGYIDWEPMKNLYYNSLGSSVPGTNTGNQNKFICSKIFTREELPVGTVIEVDSGYQYRPEGWVDLGTKNTVRPDNVKTSRVVIDEEWWGSYNYRAFNLSKTDLSDICTDFEESCTHFRIFVPEQ